MDNIDRVAAGERGIEVKNVVGYSTESVAEHFFMLLLAAMRGLKPYHTAVADGSWQADGRFCLTEPSILDLHTRTLGIIGVGNIGKAITDRAKAFGMRVLWTEREGKAPRSAEYTDFDTVLAQSDIISLNTPLTEQTRHLISARTIAKMKRKPLVINVARGAVVDPQAIYDALEAGQLLGFATDVFESEPPVAGDTLLKLASHPRVLLTPHVAWASEYALDKLWKKVKSQIEEFIK
jgi:glycerate dehydrogenase